ncbi:MAG: cell division protein ZipA C-terminal FtsZ-binding domain-containing protein [Sulfuritalea sp.]|nr:cell division protein ZipA C-terminal FtsZ-binding domain-containing protein [Sulfuritalea sp.]
MALSELHIALIGAGVAGVLMVWGYNLWQDRKHRKTAERIFSGGAGDAMEAAPAPAPELAPAAERHEPTLGVEAAEDFVSPVPEPITEHDEVPAAYPAPTSDVAAATDGPPAGGIDDIADLTLRFSAAAPIAAPIVYSVQRGWAGDISKPVSWLARGGDGGRWRPIMADDEGGYREWAVGVQLVDRRGPLGEGELAAFVAGVQALAQQTGAALDALPDLDEIAANANALDQFCAAVDIQFVLHVVDATGGTFAGTKLRGLAEAAGLALEADGLFHARDEAGGELFSLGNLGSEGFNAESLRTMATHGLTFSLDVPRVSDGRAAFEKMLGAARQIAGALNGVLVDAQRAPLADAMIAAIRAKTVELQQRMRDGGIDPGSPRALRLFS